MLLESKLSAVISECRIETVKAPNQIFFELSD